MNNTKHELEPHQIRDIYRLEDLPLKNSSGKTVSYLFYSGGILFAIVLVLSFLIKIPRESNLKFVLLGGKEENIYQYPEKIHIIKKYVPVGKSVSNGSKLIQITSPKIVSLIYQVEEAEKNLKFFTEHQIQTLDNDILFERSILEGLQIDLQRNLIELTALKKGGDKDLEILDTQLQNVQKQHGRNEKLFEKGAISEVELDKSKFEVENAQSKLNEKQGNYLVHIEQSNSTIASLKHRIASKKVEIENLYTKISVTQKRLENDLENAKNHLLLNYGNVNISNNSIELLATNTGTIAYVTEQEADVNEDHILVRLQVSQTDYYAIGNASSKQVGELRERQSVILKYESFPHYYYGTMKGSIFTLSSSPDESGNYLVKIRIEEKGKIMDKVTKGMQGTASIVIEEKPVFDFVFRIFMKKTSFE